MIIKRVPKGTTKTDFEKALLAMEFEDGKHYLCFLHADIVEPSSLSTMDFGGDADITFVLIVPGKPVYECVRAFEVKDGTIIFADNRCIDAVSAGPYMRMVDTGGKPLHDVIISGGKDVREECAGVADVQATGPAAHIADPEHGDYARGWSECAVVIAAKIRSGK